MTKNCEAWLSTGNSNISQLNVVIYLTFDTDMSVLLLNTQISSKFVCGALGQVRFILRCPDPVHRSQRWVHICLQSLLVISYDPHVTFCLGRDGTESNGEQPKLYQ